MSDQSQNKKQNKLFAQLFFPAIFILSLWIIKIFEITTDTSFSTYGIYPRKLDGLVGIFFYPLIHGDINHLINNSTALIVLMVGVFHFYRPVSYKIFFWTYLLSGIWVWLSARPSYHIGASGLIYGFASFIFLSGIIRQNTNLLALSMLVIFLYGSMVWGIFPIRPGMSWEGHLWGSVAGIILAIYYRKQGPQKKKYSWEIEEMEEMEEPAQSNDSYSDNSE